jgi:hypothetical protein
VSGLNVDYKAKSGMQVWHLNRQEQTRINPTVYHIPLRFIISMQLGSRLSHGQTLRRCVRVSCRTLLVVYLYWRRLRRFANINFSEPIPVQPCCTQGLVFAGSCHRMHHETPSTPVPQYLMPCHSQQHDPDAWVNRQLGRGQGLQDNGEGGGAAYLSKQLVAESTAIRCWAHVF